MPSIIHAIQKTTTIGLENLHLIFKLCKKTNVQWDFNKELLHPRSIVNINMYTRIGVLDLKLDLKPHISTLKTIAHSSLTKATLLH